MGVAGGSGSADSHVAKLGLQFRPMDIDADMAIRFDLAGLQARLDVAWFRSVVDRRG